MARFSPAKTSDHTQIFNEDQTVHISPPLYPQRDIVARPENKTSTNDRPLSNFFQLYYGGGPRPQRIRPYPNIQRKRLWHSDVFIFGMPCSALTVIRFIQLVIVNLASSILPCTNVRMIIEESPAWSVMPALGIHCLLFVAEESTLYEFSPRRSGLQLGYAYLISVLYASCEVYLCLLSSIVYFNQLVTSIVLLVGSIFFLANHWYLRVTSMYLVETIVRFNEITRPETIDNRLNIGPQLVFPVPEEFSIPGDYGV